MVKIHAARGRSALGLLTYVLHPGKQSLGDGGISTNMFGLSALELSQEFNFFSDLHPLVQRIMCHYSVSLPPGEVLDAELMMGLTTDLLALMGHDGLFVAVRHFDREHLNNVQHFHLVASAINFDGSWVDDGFDRLTLKSIERRLELSFGLASPQPALRPFLTTGEFRRKQRTQEVLPKERLWELIAVHAADQPSFPLLVTRLIADDVQVRFRTDMADGGISGISFAIDGAIFRGGQLGQAFSFSGLQEHFGMSLDGHEIPELLGLQALSGEDCRELLAQRSHLQARYEFWCNQAGSDDDLVVAIAIRQCGQVQEFPCLLFSPAALAIQRASGKAAQFQYLQELTGQSVKLAQRNDQSALER